MKFAFKITLLAIVISMVYIYRDDLSSLYQKANYWVNNINEITVLSNKIEGQNIEEQKQIKKYIETPGPLKYIKSTLKGDTITNLSISGVIESTNKSRASNGELPPLTENSKLNISAEIKARDIFANQYFEHISPGGVGVSDLAKEVSYDYLLIGENLALGAFKDNESLVDAWMASPGHRANILNKNYSEIGVAVVYGKYNGNNVWVAVQHFGLPESFCPKVDHTLLDKIKSNESLINELKSYLSGMKTSIDSGEEGEPGNTLIERITKYNNVVTEFNNLIKEIKKEINNYNDSVNTFNKCISSINDITE